MTDTHAVAAGRPRWRTSPIPLSRVTGRTRNTAAAVALVIAAVVTAIVAGPSVHATGALTEVDALDLGTVAPASQIQTRGKLEEDERGYLAEPYATARVTVPLELPSQADADTLLRLWVYGSETVKTSVVVVAADGSRQPLGNAGTWVGKTFDVTQLARGGDVRLEVTAKNQLASEALFLDRIAPVLAPHTAVASASTWSVALLVALTAAALLAVFGRLRRHWPLPLALAGFAALVWHRIPPASLDPLPLASIPTWDQAVAASWFGFHDGLLWGSWNGVSSLATQLFHAFGPIVGDAAVSARSAALLAALLALAAVYALGHRVAGLLGAVVAVLIAIAAPPLRDAAADGGSLPVLVLAGALFAYGLHACLAKATPLAVALLAAGLSLVALAEPLWLPGALVAIPVVVLARGERGARRRALGAGALVAVIVLGPHLASTAAQNDGSPLADVSARAFEARNAEFAGGGHGAPTAAEALRDPSAGDPVTLSGYVLGDHSLTQVVGGTLTGGQQALSAFGSGGSPLGAIAFVLALLGVVYVLILPQLRLLALVPLLVALPALFVVGRTEADAFAAGAVWWPVLPAGAAVLAYAVVKLARPSVESRLGRSRTPVRGAAREPRA